MAVSKKRKKKGKDVQNNPARRASVLEQMESSVSLQDLINVLAYQEYVKDGTIVEDILTVENIDFENPDVQAVIRAVSESSKYDDKVEEQE